MVLFVSVSLLNPTYKWLVQYRPFNSYEFSLYSVSKISLITITLAGVLPPILRFAQCLCFFVMSIFSIKPDIV